MINWFKKKSKKDELAKSLLEWYEENEGQRAAFMVILDKESGFVTSGVYGNGEDIANAIISECLNEEDIASLLVTSTKCYLEMKASEEEETMVEEKPKRRRRKSDKVVS